MEREICYPLKNENCEEILWDCSALLYSSRRLKYLGKGTDSIVFEIDGLALKVSRTDRMRIAHREADILRYIYWNSREKIAPKVLSNTKYCILMEKIDGEEIEEAAEILPPNQLRIRIENLLMAAFMLDSLGVKHGELARAGKHVLFMKERPIFIDFGSASITNRAHNLPQLLSQLVFSRNKVAEAIKKKLGLRREDESKLLELARIYKKEESTISGKMSIVREMIKLIVNS